MTSRSARSGSARWSRYVALRRRAQLGWQWPLLLAGGVSIIAGVVYLIAAAGADPMLNLLVLYAATGGVELVVQAGLLARRRRRLANPAVSVLSAS